MLIKKLVGVRVEVGGIYCLKRKCVGKGRNCERREARERKEHDRAGRKARSIEHETVGGTRRRKNEDVEIVEERRVRGMLAWH